MFDDDYTSEFILGEEMRTTHTPYSLIHNLHRYIIKFCILHTIRNHTKHSYSIHHFVLTTYSLKHPRGKFEKKKREKNDGNLLVSSGV